MEEIYDEAVVTAAEAILRQILLHLAQWAENELFAMCCVEYAAVIPAFSAEDILCAESRDHGSVLHTTHGEQFILCPLSQMQEYLPKDRFCRCHNSFIVNLFHIRRVSSRTICLTDGRDLSIGRRYDDRNGGKPCVL